MQGCVLGFVGLVFGAIVGAILGVGVGLTCAQLFHASDFEGYSGMVVFFSFMPLGALAGGLAGPILPARAGARAKSPGRMSPADLATFGC